MEHMPLLFKNNLHYLIIKIIKSNKRKKKKFRRFKAENKVACGCLKWKLIWQKRLILLIKQKNKKSLNLIFFKWLNDYHLILNLCILLLLELLWVLFRELVNPYLAIYFQMLFSAWCILSWMSCMIKLHSGYLWWLY